MPGSKIWLQLLRAPFFTASLIPMLVGACLALICPTPVSWNLLPLILLAGVLVHAGTNVLNDYFDFKESIDTPTSFGSSHVLTSNQVNPSSVRTYGMTLLLLSFLLGLILVSIRGKTMFLIGIIGIAAGYAYTGRPFFLKYRGLGNPLVFIMMGPLMVIGAYYALTGTYNQTLLITSLPVGFLVTAILAGNNIRDIAHDRDAHITTFEIALGFNKARIFYDLLLIGAYISIITMVVTRLHSWWILITFLSFPRAFKNIRLLHASKNGSPQEIAAIDVQTAQLHLIFGTLFLISLILESLVR